MPFLPPEMVSCIISYYCSHDHPILLIPKHSLGKDYNQGHMLDSSDHTQIQPASDQPPPAQVHNALYLDFLLVNKSFYNQGIKHFYSENAFSLLGGAHVNDLLGMLDFKKRALIRHITLESQWELEVLFQEANQQETYKFSVNHLWGRYTIEDLVNTTDASRSIFPNLQSISLRARCKWNKDWQWFTPFRPHVVVVEHPNKHGTLELREDDDPMEQESMRGLAEQNIASAVKEIWGYSNVQSYLPMTDIKFQYSETDQWDDRASTVPLLSLS